MNQIRTSALIGLGALGILFGRKMPGVQVIADEARIARYAAQPVVCNGEECRFSYVTPAQGKPVDLLLVAVKATVLDQAIADMKNFVGPDTVILSVLNGITSEEHIETAYPGRTLWSVAIGMDATRSGRTLVFNQAGKIQFGERDGTMTGRVQAVADYLDACGIANEPCSDILYKQWNKLMVNDGLNQAAAAFDLRRAAPVGRGTGKNARGYAGSHPAGQSGGRAPAPRQRRAVFAHCHAHLQPGRHAQHASGRAGKASHRGGGICRCGARPRQKVRHAHPRQRLFLCPHPGD